MSGQLNGPAATSGPPPMVPGLWQVFVQAAVEVTLQGYEQLRGSALPSRAWEEDQFTIHLESFIRPIALRDPTGCMFIRSQVREYTPTMYTGQTSVKNSKIIDLELWGVWDDYDKVYFAWECKLIGDSSADGCKDLPNEYVKNGMFRFIDGEYARHVDSAGMIGYVRQGRVPDIVVQINTSMISARRARALTVDDQLQPNATPRFANQYRSRHKRVADGSEIALHHLFMEFDYAA